MLRLDPYAFFGTIAAINFGAFADQYFGYSQMGVNHNYYPENGAFYEFNYGLRPGDRLPDIDRKSVQELMNKIKSACCK